MKASILIATYNSAPVIRTQLDALAASTAWTRSSSSYRTTARRTTPATSSRRTGTGSSEPWSSTRRRCGGVSHARNAGAAAASGVDLLFLDHDDEVAEGSGSRR